MSNVRTAIFDSTFLYERPWFYNNDLSLRCELGAGDGEMYMISAMQRAKEIYNVLFNDKVDCFFIDNYIYDDFDSNEFLEKYKARFPYDVVKINVATQDDDSPREIIRYVFYPTSDIINEMINNNINDSFTPRINIVSFTNECIYSIYDDRGCDIVFFDKNKYCEMYKKLSSYLLDYDAELMKERFNKATAN